MSEAEEELKQANELLQQSILWYREFIQTDPLRDIAFSLRQIAGTLVAIYNLASTENPEKSQELEFPQRDPPPVA